MTKRRRTALLTAALMAVTSLLAMPAWKGKLKQVQKDGTILTYYLQGDEWGHHMLTADGLCLKPTDAGLAYQVDDVEMLAHDAAMRTKEELDFVEKHKAELASQPMLPRTLVPRKAKASDMQIGSFPTKGDAHGLIILADFSDLPFTLTREYHERMMNEEGFCDYDVEGEVGFVGSARDYFIDQSRGLFSPTFDVVGPVHLTHNYAYYGRNDALYGTDQDAEKMIVEACKLADEKEDVDFSQYDYDGDGYVDMVYVIFAGFGENAGGGANTVWPKKWNLLQAGYNLQLDGKQVDVFACSSELFGNEGEQTASIAQFCHEFGHVLGFADHYNTTDSRQYNLGAYDLMDYGGYNNDSRTPPSYNAFERMTVGWLTPEELRDAEDGVELVDINRSNRAYRLSTTNPQEFYLLENRQQEGWDSFIPGSGLMITHVDFDKSLWNGNQVNNEANHRRFYLECADNEPGYNVLLQKLTEEHDLFPNAGNDSFTDVSTPKASPYTRETLDKWLTNIRNEGGLVTFDFMNNHLKTPSHLAMSHVGANQFTATWVNNDARSESYSLRLTHLLREQELLVPVQEDFDLMTVGSSNNGDSNDISDKLDEYMMSKGWTGENVFQAGGTVQIGKVGTDGRLLSPKMNFSSFNRDFAILLKVNSAVGKQPVLTVTANGMQAKHRLTSTPRMYLYPFSGAGLTATEITIEISKERAYIDSLIIIRGTDAVNLYPNAKVVNPTGEVASTEDEPFEQTYIPAEQQTFEGIDDCQYTLTGLAEGECYSWTVQAVGGDMTSNFATERDIIVSDDYVATGVNTWTPTYGEIIGNGDSYATIYNIKGTRVKTMAQPGIYIVIRNGQPRKIVK